MLRNTKKFLNNFNSNLRSRFFSGKRRNSNINFLKICGSKFSSFDNLDLTQMEQENKLDDFYDAEILTDLEKPKKQMDKEFRKNFLNLKMPELLVKINEGIDEMNFEEKLQVYEIVSKFLKINKVIGKNRIRRVT